MKFFTYILFHSPAFSIISEIGIQPGLEDSPMLKIKKN